MSDPLRTDESRAVDAASDVDRDAKIEQLLLLGLDHYFAAQYDQAINVWTRALFLDRSHPRARAYIERARSALAERQRESEELLQNGIGAFHRGDSSEARRLLQAAIDAGAPPDEALAVLDRLNRLESAAIPARTGRSHRRLLAPRRPGAMPASLLERGIVALVLLLVIAGAAGMASWNRLDWRSLFATPNAPAAAAGAPLSRDTAPPLPRRGEMALARARALAAGGHLRDALTLLETIRATDAQKPDAERLRADIQHQLLGLATATAREAAAGDQVDRRRP